MQIDLPVHQSAGGEVVLQRIDTLLIDHEFIIHHIEHLDDACRTDITLSDARIERVAPQVVETVHIQLAGDELVEEVLRIVALEDRDGQIQLSVQVAVDLFHHHQ